jgi:tetratricopeptide (TPR) repeat protein
MRPVLIAFTISVAAQPLLLGSASQAPKTTGAASASTAACDELSKKGRALLDSGKAEEARTFLTAGIQACAGAASQPEKARLAAALITLGFIESTKQPQEALEHFRRAMALDPENMRGPLNAGAMLTSLGQFTEALDVLEKALKHGTDDKDTLFRLEYNAGFALLKMCAARQAGCDRGSMEQHFVRASELNPSFPDTWFNLAAITNDVHRDSRGAMELFKKACDLGHQQGCFQYEGFKSRIGALDRQAQGASPTEMTVEALAERIRQTYTCAAVVKSTRQPAEQGITVWTVECSGNHVYTVIVGMRGETTVIQKSK